MSKRDAERASKRLQVQQEREELIRRRDAAMARSSASYQMQQSQQQQSQQTPKGRPAASGSSSQSRESKVNKNVSKSETKITKPSKKMETSVEEESSSKSSSSSSEESSSEDENAPPPAAESVLQKLILAGVIKHGVRSVQQMTELFQRSCSFLKIPIKEDYTNFNGITNFIKDINESISEYKMSIKTNTRCEFSGQQYFVFKVDETPVAKLQTTFKKIEVDMIQNCINEMLLSDNFSISLKECVDLARKDNAKISMQDAQDFIERMIDMFYFATNMNEPAINRYNYYVTLGFRAVEELSEIIQEKQPGIIGSCRLCFQPCLHAFKCPSPTCEVLVHKFCVSNYLTTTNKCPGELQKVGACKASWDDFSSLVKRTRPVSDQDDRNNSSAAENLNANSSLESIEPVAGPSRILHGGGGTSSKSTKDVNLNRKSTKKSKKVSSTEDSDD